MLPQRRHLIITTRTISITSHSISQRTRTRRHLTHRFGTKIRNLTRRPISTRIRRLRNILTITHTHRRRRIQRRPLSSTHNTRILLQVINHSRRSLNTINTHNARRLKTHQITMMRTITRTTQRIRLFNQELRRHIHSTLHTRRSQRRLTSTTRTNSSRTQHNIQRFIRSTNLTATHTHHRLHRHQRHRQRNNRHRTRRNR